MVFCMKFSNSRMLAAAMFAVIVLGLTAAAFAQCPSEASWKALKNADSLGWDKKLAAANAIIKISPNNAAALAMSAMGYIFEKQDYKTGIANATKAINIATNNNDGCVPYWIKEDYDSQEDALRVYRSVALGFAYVARVAGYTKMIEDRMSVGDLSGAQRYANLVEEDQQRIVIMQMANESLPKSKKEKEKARKEAEEKADAKRVQDSIRAEERKVQDSIAAEAQRKEAERINKIKSYKYTGRTVIIGKQVWMAENLNNEYGGVCYDNEPSNCAMYGRLYSWDDAMVACPVGFHLPSDKEWGELIGSVGERSAIKLKSKKGWNDNGTDNYGFSALPGGIVNSRGYFESLGKTGLWWSADKFVELNEYVRCRSMVNDNNYKDVSRNNIKKEASLLSVRCVRDATEAEAKAESQRITKAQELSRTESVIRDKFMAQFDMDKMNNAYNSALEGNKKFEGYVTVSFIIKNKGIASFDMESLRGEIATRDVGIKYAFEFFIKGWYWYRGPAKTVETLPYFGEGPCTKVDISVRFGKKDKKSKSGEVNISIDKVQIIDGEICNMNYKEEGRLREELERINQEGNKR